MMRLVLRRAGGALCGVLLAVGCAYGQSWPSEGPPPPLQARPVDFPSYQLRTLPNGLQVLVIPHHEHP